MKKLPIGVSTFQSIITSAAVYVDKTEILYQLIHTSEPKRYFFSRPRRFGKSLTCSTLSSLFSGKKELFTHLWIGQSDYAWPEHPVLLFDFSQIDHETPEKLVEGLQSTLDAHAHTYGLVLKEKLLKAKFAELIKTLGQTIAPVAVIIDEYDKPIVDLVDNLTYAERSRREKFYHQIFFMVCVLFGQRPPTEVATEECFMDLLLEGTTCTFVVEFKKDSTPEAALEQIERKRYWEPYKILQNKQIILAGITFNKTETGIDVLLKTKKL